MGTPNKYYGYILAMQALPLRGPARRIAFLALSALAGATSGQAAQSPSLDEGRFVIYRNGQRAGSESFWIRQATSGGEARVIARGEISLEMAGGTREIVAALETRGPEMALSGYEVKVSGDRREEVAGRVAGRRFGTRILTEQGEQAREFPIALGTTILDQEVAHHYFFVARLRHRAPLVLPVISPRAQRHTRVRISVVGMESIAVAGSRVDVQHLRIEGDDWDETHVWVGPDDRVVRIEIPAQGYRAERDAL